MLVKRVRGWDDPVRYGVAEVAAARDTRSLLDTGGRGVGRTGGGSSMSPMNPSPSTNSPSTTPLELVVNTPPSLPSLE